jgi:ATP-dependent protease HslVU (ClpYQ) peptidase subunit
VFKHKGVCVGVAGTYEDCQRFLRWFKGSRKKPLKKVGDVHALMLTPEGKIFFFEGSAHPYLITDNFMAIGSGAQGAMAAMHMGATPRQAVTIVSKVDVNTGGKITTRSINQGI